MGDATRRRGRLLPILVVAAAAALLLAPLPHRWTRGWRGELLDLSHVPLFAGLVLVMVHRDRSPWRPALLAIGLAGAVEVAQAAVGRTADWGDFARGVLGVLAAVVGVQAWRLRRSHGQAVVLGLLATALVAGPVVGSAPRLIDAAEGYCAFPVLAEFRTHRELARWECQQAALTRATDPTRPGEWVGRLDLLPGPHPYPSGILSPVTGDFRGYRWLCCEFGVEGGPTEVVLSVRCGTDREGVTTHYQVGRTYSPGWHTARLDLPAAGPRADPVPLDPADVRAVQLFATGLSEPRTLVVRRVWLEP